MRSSQSIISAYKVQLDPMDINTSTFQTNLPAPSSVFTAPKAQFSGGLMRYHSAPSSVLAGLLDDDFSPHSEDSEFTRLLNDGIGSFSTLLETRATQEAEKSQAGSTMDVNKEDPYLNHGIMNDQHSHYMGTGSSLQEQPTQSPLSAILEHATEVTVHKYCSHELPLTVGGAQSAAQSSYQNSTDSSSHNSVLTLDSNYNSLTQSKSHLIRHSSSPADFLSRLVLEETSERPLSNLGGGLAGQHCTVHSKPEEKFGGQSFLSSPQPALGSCFTEDKNTGNFNESLSLRRPNVLLRQSSSPAGLLSQLALEEISMARGKVALASSSGGSSVHGWDDTATDLAMQHLAAFGQRKRGRGLEDKMLMKGLQGTPVDLPNNFSAPTTSSPGCIDSMEGSAVDSLLCKARAKRGCATHPRSIAERVRRTKISERIRKLQDLVPNLDKQASTAEMLDEVVEYIKLLQRQVQELSLNRPPCNGICQQEGNSPL